MFISIAKLFQRFSQEILEKNVLSIKRKKYSFRQFLIGNVVMRHSD